MVVITVESDIVGGCLEYGGEKREVTERPEAIGTERL